MPSMSWRLYFFSAAQGFQVAGGALVVLFGQSVIKKEYACFVTKAGARYGARYSNKRKMPFVRPVDKCYEQEAPSKNTGKPQLGDIFGNADVPGGSLKKKSRHTQFSNFVDDSEDTDTMKSPKR